MHGYYMDVRLYNKAKLVANPFNYEEEKLRKIKQKINEETQRTIKTTKKLPKVNTQYYERLLEDQDDDNKAIVKSAKNQLTDDRFSSLFQDNEFDIEAESDTFKRLNPVLNRIGKKKQKQMMKDKHEEEEELRLKMAENKDSSDSDSIISSDESEEEMEPKVSIFIVYNCLLIVF